MLQWEGADSGDPRWDVAGVAPGRCLCPSGGDRPLLLQLPPLLSLFPALAPHQKGRRGFAGKAALEFWGAPVGATSRGELQRWRRERSCGDLDGERPGLASSSCSCCPGQVCHHFSHWNPQLLEGRRDVPRREKFRKGMDNQTRTLPHLSYKPNQCQGRATGGEN